MKEMGMFHGPIGSCDFNAMQSCPPPKHLQEQRESIVPGMVNVWYEYLPEKYDPEQKYPLIVQLHGGGMDGRRWAEHTIWHLLAEEYGLIVIYPNSPDYQTWRLGKRDVEYLYDLITLVCSRYSVDRSRIFMQGMSNGDQMTLAFSMAHPEMLAAAGFATGPTAAELFEKGEMPRGPLPVIQMRGEKDVMEGGSDIYEKRYAINDLNRDIWKQVNGLDALPSLTVRGKDNFLYYPGRQADLILWEVRDMGHREPAGEAQVFWDCLYSGCSRMGNELVIDPVRRPLPGDDDGFLLSLGSDKFYHKDSILPINPAEPGFKVQYLAPMSVGGFGSYGLDEMLETGALFAPAELLAAAFGASLRYSADGSRLEARFPEGRVLRFWAGTALVRDGERYTFLKKPSVQLCGRFLLPIGEICEDLLDLNVSEADDCMLITAHQAQLGRYTARTMRELLGGIRRPIKQN